MAITKGNIFQVYYINQDITGVLRVTKIRGIRRKDFWINKLASHSFSFDDIHFRKLYVHIDLNIGFENLHPSILIYFDDPAYTI